MAFKGTQYSIDNFTEIFSKLSGFLIRVRYKVKMR